MKNIVFAVILSFIGTYAFAQENAELVKLQDRVQTLETLMQSQNRTISSLQAKVDEVTKQNLALKQSLNLQPTVAEAKDNEGNVMRIMEVVGDSVAKTVLVRGTCVNMSGVDTYLLSGTPNYIDENGKEYQLNYDNGFIGATHITNTVTLIPDTPLEVKMTFTDVDSNAQFIKALDMSTNFSGRSLFRFLNLPIKWK